MAEKLTGESISFPFISALKNTATVPARYPLTMFRTMNLFWKPEYKQAYNLLLCFAVAAQEARRIYGVSSVVELQKTFFNYETPHK